MNNIESKEDQLALIQSKIYEVRGVKVMLDKDLAELYHVTTGNLNKAVKRNIRRFPSDFMFQLTKEEWDSLRFQIGILEVGRGKLLIRTTSTRAPVLSLPLLTMHLLSYNL